MRDVLDHNIQAADQIASYDEMLSSLVQAALGKVGMQQNIDMRKISAWVAIAAVPTMIAGIYGMNFEHMPELKWTWGYPAVLTADVLRLPDPVSHLPARTTGSIAKDAELQLGSCAAVAGSSTSTPSCLPCLPHRVGALEPHPRRLGRR